MEDYIHRKEHEEFVKRMESEHKRYSRRLDSLETATKQINELTISIAKMASSMEQMLAEQQEQGTRLKVLEARDGEKWRTFIGYVVVAVISGLVGFLFKSLGL